MDNKFTGVNREELVQQVNNIGQTLGEIINGYERDLGNFFKNLRKYWASENAFKFSINIKTLITAYMRNIGTYADRILDDLDNSLDKYLTALGEYGYPVMYGDYKNYNLKYEDCFVLDTQNTDGVSGMNIHLVEDLITNELPLIKTYALSRVDELPSNISFFDESGEQLRAYSIRKQSMKTLVEELLNELETQIRFNIETEKNNILLAKQQVVQNMNGSSSANA